MFKSNGFFVNEMFGSLEGEGPHVGSPTYFIRLQGCDVNCSWCDTQKALPIPKEDEHASFISLQELRHKILHTRYPRYSITGGNPLLQDINIIAAFCLEANYKAQIHLEHPGVLPCSDDVTFSPVLSLFSSIGFDLKTPSSRVSNKHALSYIKKIDRLWNTPEWAKSYIKIPLFTEEDITFAWSVISAFENTPIYLSLGEGKQCEINLDRVVKLVKDINSPKVKLGFQLHKLLGFE